MDDKLDRSISKTAYPEEKPADAGEGGQYASHSHRRSSVQIIHDLIAEGDKIAPATGFAAY
jgi:hypothetical protein